MDDLCRNCAWRGLQGHVSAKGSSLCMTEHEHQGCGGWPSRWQFPRQGAWSSRNQSRTNHTGLMPSSWQGHPNNLVQIWYLWRHHQAVVAWSKVKTWSKWRYLQESSILKQHKVSILITSLPADHMKTLRTVWLRALILFLVFVIRK